MKRFSFVAPLILLFVFAGCPAGNGGSNDGLVGKWILSGQHGSVAFTFYASGTFSTLATDGSTIYGTWEKTGAGSYYAEYSNSNVISSVVMTLVINVTGDEMSCDMSLVTCQLGNCETKNSAFTGVRATGKTAGPLAYPEISHSL